MTLLTPEQLAVRRRNRNMLVALFVLFFGGMLVAGLLRFSGWRPDGTKNKGEMLQPYGDLRGYTPTLADGSAYGWKDEPRIWRIVAMPRDCDTTRAAECTRLLADFDKVWRLMTKDADRVHVLWAGAMPPGATVPEEVRLVRADDGLRAGLVRWEDTAGGDAAWLVDPNGFVVLRYAPGFDPGDLRTDLARLLKIN
ncbi:hypothetical protein [Thermomonas carbonis]|uniref:Cytochrome C oxidase subunit I n=1 Tax=Thermomonas carbonis TaxID=1463158 RepID=A0A7G9SSC2_9GAMM|nr:hypothetical protein [Thermomonas carbonis]QNN70747.1 hypothetical protein H9L16_03830 [Thermomonas carbonis]GHC02041.1 hypothetical protein GCM10010080_14760 [Thermomonas carbonis]